MAACCVPVRRDYTVPLHVDCSVEYELPAHAKPPPGVRVEPLLMIHPCHFRRLESQRRRPFVNNLPRKRRSPNVIPNQPIQMQSVPIQESIEAYAIRRVVRAHPYNCMPPRELQVPCLDAV